AYVLVPNRIGRITLVTAAERAADEARANVIRAATAPRFVEENLAALPWHSGQAVVETIDDTVYWEALRRGIIHESGYDRIRRRQYASGFAVTREVQAAFEAAGYQRVTDAALGSTAYYRLP